MVAGAGSVRSSAGTYTACTEVMDPLLGGCDSFLQCAHFCCQGRLISYGGWHTSQQCRYFRTCLGETENIIDEQQHILMFFITEIFCHRQPGQCNTHSGTRRFVHLSEYHGRLFDNARTLSFRSTRSLPSLVRSPYAGENGNTAVLCRNVADQLLDQYGFSYAGTAEQTDLTALGVRRRSGRLL